MTRVNHASRLNSSATSLVSPVCGVDADTLLGLHAQHPERYPVLLQSSAAGHVGRNFDILMAFPGERLTLDRHGRLIGDEAVETSTGGFLPALDRWWQACRPVEANSAPDALPFTGGWFLFLAYEFAAQIEPRLRLPLTPDCLAQAIRIPAAIVRCTQTGQAWLVAEADSAALLEQLKADVKNVAQWTSSPVDSLLAADLWEEPAEVYLRAVESALQHIAAGDVYQANLSREWRGTLRPQTPAHEVYRRLCIANPAPFAGLAKLDDFAIVSSSPERLIEVRDGWANTRPIAGTRPRSASEIQDRVLLRELRAHPKEQAEHVMLLDLERNDLGRVCERGSVKVDEYMTLESYAHVHHIVSNVRGRLRADVTPGEAIAAVFPGGTITGCPKIRCMEIIAALEGTPRGCYTGSMGYLNRDGSLDLNILIRTLHVQGDRVIFRAGAGIVADSDPLRELEETRAKALGMIRALRGGAA